MLSELMQWWWNFERAASFWSMIIALVIIVLYVLLQLFLAWERSRERKKR